MKFETYSDITKKDEYAAYSFAVYLEKTDILLRQGSGIFFDGSLVVAAFEIMAMSYAIASTPIGSKVTANIDLKDFGMIYDGTASYAHKLARETERLKQIEASRDVSYNAQEKIKIHRYRKCHRECRSFLESYLKSI